jgi:predicted SprT family Zn-dependent metalloprotease
MTHSGPNMEARTERLSGELERAALHAIYRSWEDMNGALFRFQLARPAIELTDSSSRLGRWHGGLRVIELARSLLVEHGWGVLIEVLKHEMAHQYVDEVLGQPDDSMHGAAFRRVCEERGIDASAAGVPQPEAEKSVDQHLLGRIAKLLALAESSNEHEAQAAMSAAQRLMLKYNIDLAVSGRQAAYGFRHLGEPSGRVNESQRILAGILSDHFFVQTIWVPVWRPLEGRRGSVLEICGSDANLELAEYVHAFLNVTAERLFREYRRTPSGRRAKRLTFIAGVMSGFRARLEREQKKSKSEGLVWVGDAALDGFFRKRHPRIRWQRYAVGHGSEAYTRGREAGEKIVLHRGVRGNSGGTAPRLLPPAKP